MAVAFGVYTNSLPNKFVYDDHPVVVRDERSHSLSRIGELFSGGYWTVTKTPAYRPLTLLSFALNHAVTGLSAPGYRAVNILLHGLTCAAVYRLMTLLYGRFWPALVAGAVYAVHPIHVEAVVPIVGRSELLSGFAVVAALALYVGDAARGGRGITWRYLAVILLAWAAILCKESGIVLVGMAVVFDLWRRWCTPPDRRGRKWAWDSYVADRFLWRYAGILAAVLVALSMRQSAIGMMFGGGLRYTLVDNALMGSPWPARILTGLLLFGKYVHLLMTGHPLCYDYSYNAIPLARSMTWPVAWGVICVAVLVVVVLRSLRRRREAALAAGLFLTSYAPVSNILLLISTTFAERLMYLPSVLAAAAWGLAVPGATTWLWRRGSTGSRGIAVGLVAATVAALATYSVLTVLRNRDWRDNETLFRHGLDKHPESARCRYNLGSLLVSLGRFEEGIKHLRRAVEIADRYYLARTKLANCYLILLQWQDAADVLAPLVEGTTSRSKHLVSPLYMAGRARLEMGELASAWENFETLRKIEPRHAEAMSCQAEIMTRPEAGSLYKPTEGWALIQQAVNLDPENLVCLATAARIALRRRLLVEARLYLKRAFEAAREQIEAPRKYKLDRAQMRALQAVVRDLKNMRAALKRLREERRRKVLTPTTRQGSSPRQPRNDARD